MAEPIPVILCGKTEQIAKTVIPALLPEIEVVHFVMTPEAGREQIPALLQGKTDVPANSALGSKDYSRGVAAVILGGGYDDAGIDYMRAGCDGSKAVPWLRPDLSKPAPPLGPEYGKAMVERIKALLREIGGTEKMNESAVLWY